MSYKLAEKRMSTTPSVLIISCVKTLLQLATADRWYTSQNLMW